MLYKSLENTSKLKFQKLTKFYRTILSVFQFFLNSRKCPMRFHLSTKKSTRVEKIADDYVRHALNLKLIQCK